MEEVIEIKYEGNVCMGMPILYFRFNLTKERKKYKYQWINPPKLMKEVLDKKEFIIKSKTELDRKDLLYYLEDMYEAYHEEKGTQVSKSFLNILVNYFIFPMITCTFKNVNKLTEQ